MADEYRTVRCDECGCAFEPEIEVKTEGEIESAYYKCPYCGKAYLICVTDAELRRHVQEYKGLYLSNRKKRLSQRMQKRMQKLKTSNMKRCEELKAQYPLVLEQEVTQND